MPLATPSESSSPLADFFWIAGLDGKEVEDTYWKLRNEYVSNRESAPGPAISDTIEEDSEHEETDDDAVVVAANTRRSSQNRLSKLSSSDARLSIQSGESKLAESSQGSGSNRSSMTIRAGSGMMSGFELPNGEFDFDKALLKFASERESFLSDLSLSAGAITPARPKPRAKMQKIVSEEKPASTNPLKSGIGSVRRSFRDMNSMKRQPSVARQGKWLGLVVCEEICV
jgi:hypothetical protein